MQHPLDTVLVWEDMLDLVAAELAGNKNGRGAFFGAFT